MTRWSGCRSWRIDGFNLRGHLRVKSLRKEPFFPEPSGLGLTDFAVLEALLHKGPLTITEIHRKVLLALGSITAAVDRLEKKGLIIRTAAQDDRRSKLLKLTPEGKRVVEEAFSRHAAELQGGIEPERKARASRSSEEIGAVCSSNTPEY
jgi:DNA-binding MarR family transcriptional regulator